jgi:FkbM family methyltransferase
MGIRLRVRAFNRIKRMVARGLARFVDPAPTTICPYHGAYFLVRRNDPEFMNAKIWLGNFEREQIRSFKELCQTFSPDVFIDVGANCGLYSCVLLRNELTPHAILFEPDRHALSLLRANLMINGVQDRASIHEVAVGAGPARMTMRPANAKSIAGARLDPDCTDGTPVDVVALDDAVATRNGRIAVKVDVEDHEFEALTGMRQLLTQNKAVVQIETWHPARLREEMTSLGYRQVRKFDYEFVFTNWAHALVVAGLTVSV